MFREGSHQADPRVLQNNVFDDRNGGVLYRDEGGTDLTSDTAINGLGDIPRVGGNVHGSCSYASFPTDVHLTGADAVCTDAGTTSGAPADDFEGDARSDGSPDIGPDER